MQKGRNGEEGADRKGKERGMRESIGDRPRGPHD